MALKPENIHLKKRNPRGIPDDYTYFHPTDTIADITASGYFSDYSFTNDNPRFTGFDLPDTEAVAIQVQCADGPYEVQLIGGAASVIRPQGSQIAVATQAQGYGREYPTLRKLPSNPIIELADQSAISILWPYIVDMSVGGEEGYALFWSTDHASDENSGIWLATAPTPMGPWSQHGRVFRDTTTGGEQTETPSVIWNEVDSRWQLYYQLKDVPGYTNQLTMLATSDSILTGGEPSEWSIVGVSATEEYTNNAGDGHSGYFNPFRVNGWWYAYSLYGGTNNSRKALWTSVDNGVTWQVDPNIMGNKQHLIKHFSGFDTESWMVKINNGAVFQSHGGLWLVAPVGAASAGGEDTLYRTGVFKISSDGVTLSPGIDVTEPLQEWEDPLIGVDEFGSAVMHNGRMYVTFKSGGGEGGFGLVEVI